MDWRDYIVNVAEEIEFSVQFLILLWNIFMTDCTEDSSLIFYFQS